MAPHIRADRPWGNSRSAQRGWGGPITVTDRGGSALTAVHGSVRAATARLRLSCSMLIRTRPLLIYYSTKNLGTDAYYGGHA